MKKNKYSIKDLMPHFRRSDTIYVKFFLLPIASRITLFFLNYTKLKPVQVSLVGLLFGLISAFLFLNNANFLAAIVFQFSLLFDFVDGLIARVRKIPSIIGILADCYIDIAVTLINSFAIIIGNFDNYNLVIFLNAYLIVHYIESWIDFGIFSIFKFLKKEKKIVLNKLDIFLMKVKNLLEKQKLRVIFFYYHERYFLIFVLGPIFNMIEQFILFTLIATIVTINFKVIFDISMIKHSLKYKKKESFKFRSEINE